MVNVLTFSTRAFEAHFRLQIRQRPDIAEHVTALDAMDAEEIILEAECLGSMTALVLAAEEERAVRLRRGKVLHSCIRDLSRLNEEQFS